MESGYSSSSPECGNSLQELIAILYEIFESDRVNIEEVQNLLSNYRGNPCDFKKFSIFDENRYNRKLVDEGNGKFDLILVCWGKGPIQSPIHDHSDSHCFMKILEGSLSEVRFAWPDQEGKGEHLEETSRIELLKNEVSYMNDALGLHRVENTSQTERAISLHLYSPPISTCVLFDQRNGQRTKCQVTFWSKYGAKIKNEMPESTPSIVQTAT